MSNKLTLKEIIVLSVMRAFTDWLCWLPDDAWEAYLSLTEAEQLALYRSMPFYRQVQS